MKLPRRKAWARRCVEIYFFASLAFACSSKEGQAPEPSSVQVHLQVRSTEGEALKGVEMSWQPLGARTSNTSRGTLRSDAEGKVLIAVPLATGVQLSAECPQGYTGGGLDRRLLPALLRSSKKWSLELVCEPEEVSVTLAVLSSGCGELALTLDGAALGSTRDGVLHEIVRRGNVASLELVASPLKGGCELDRGSRILELDRLRPHLWVKFEGKKKAASPRRMKRRPPKSSRPYRL